MLPPSILLWAHLPYSVHQEKLNIKFLLMLNGVREGVGVLQALFLSVHLSTMFVFFTSTWCC